MHIVVVDPSRVTLKLIAEILIPRGHQVDVFCDASAALSFVTERRSVDVLITSLETEPIPGTELCWRTRLLADTGRPIYIIVMSSMRSERKLAEALDSGADDFIDKPPGAEELNARLRAAERLMSMQRELMRLAHTDHLSGLLNRRAFFQQMKDAIDRMDRYDEMSAIIFDIDLFKQVNDTCGHDVGDMVIKAVANVAAQENGIVARLGGEEFAVVLPGHTIWAASDVANRLKERCSQLTFCCRNTQLTVTCSFGVSEWSEGDTLDGFLKKADLALYEAKSKGRNRVIVWSPSSPRVRSA